jgi:hypothetical protein
VGDGDSAGPPRPRLTLRVGITGHRAEQLDDMAETAAMDIARALAVLRGAVLRLAEAEKELFADEPPLLRCLSALASGSDQLAARAALELDYRLSAPLPFVRNDYFQDFTNADEEAAFDYLIARCDAVFELDGSRAEETEAYEAAGLTVLRQSDVLLAVWDGEPARGRGGTAEIVRTALESAIPVIWIKPGESGARLLDGRDADHLDDSSALHRRAPLADDEHLGRLVTELLGPPVRPSKRMRRAARRRHHAPPVGEERSRPRLLAFLAEQERRTPPVLAYKLLLVLARAADWRIDNRSWEQHATERWEPYQTALADHGVATPTPIGSRLFRAYAWADGLATYYGVRHRDVAIRNFLSAALAVFLALIGLFETIHPAKPVLVILELIVLILVIYRTWRALHFCWHERWTDYRGLGERLRLSRILSLVGSSAIERVDRRQEPPRHWASWYLAAIEREVDLPNQRADSRYLAATLDVLKRFELEDQIGYHRRNFEQTHKLERMLHWTGIGSLALTILLGFWYLTGCWPPGRQPPHLFGLWVAVAAAFLPAVGAACLGIRDQSELGRRRNLSLVMIDRLRRLRIQLWCLRRGTTLAEVSSLAEATAAAMSSEVSDWSFLFRTRPISLPG